MGDLSDHMPIFLSIRNIMNESSHDPVEIEYRILNDRTIGDFRTDLENQDFSSVVNCNDVCVATETFEDVVMQKYNINCPIVTKMPSPRNIKKPWICGSIVVFIKKKNDRICIFYSDLV